MKQVLKPHGIMLQSLKTVGQDVSDGIIAVTHNALALIGFGVLLLAVLLLGRPDARLSTEQQVLNWLQSRLTTVASAVAEPAPETLLPAGNAGLVLQAQMDDLPTQQKRVAEWLSRRYRIAPDPMAHMVAAAYDTAGKLKLDPLLVLSVAAIESSFNPFVQSGVGAQGLMQVMSDKHEDKFDRFGGTNAAFDPVTSIKVGAVILKEYVSRAGNVEGGLKLYVGAANMDNDGGYGQRVLSERMKLTDVAAGKRVPVFSNSLVAVNSATEHHSLSVAPQPQAVETGVIKASETRMLVPQNAPSMPSMNSESAAPMSESKPAAQSAASEIS